MKDGNTEVWEMKKKRKNCNATEVSSNFNLARKVLREKWEIRASAVC